MRIRTRSDRLAEFVRVLRGFGLTDDEITALNGAPVADGDPEAVLDRTMPDDLSPPELFEHVRRTLVESRHGFELAPTHEPRSGFVALSLALEPYGCTFAVTDKSGRPITAPASEDGTYRLSLMDSAGNERTTTFAYPEGPLKDTNVPALTHAVETDLLVGVSKTFVLLSNTGDGWGFVLLDEAQLENLRQQYGDRIEVFDHQLLASTQPAAYGDGTWRAEVQGTAAMSNELVARGPGSIPLDLEVSPDESEAETADPESGTIRERIQEFDPDESVETIVDKLTSEDEPNRPDPLFVGDPVDSVFEDFSDVRLEPMEHDEEGNPDAGDQEPPAIDGAVPAGDSAAHSRRVLVGGGDGGSGPAVVVTGTPDDRDVDDALETRFEQFSDGLPAVVPEAEGTKAFRWRGIQEDVPPGSVSSNEGREGTGDDAEGRSSNSGFRFDHELAATDDTPSGERSENTDSQQSDRSAETNLAIHSLDGTDSGVDEASAGRSTDEWTVDPRTWSIRFDHLRGWLSRKFGR
jgi:hypothetical protein